MTDTDTLPMTRVQVPALDALIGKKLYCLNDQGWIMLVDYMGDDSAIVQAARTSYGKGTKTVSEDEGLIRFLMRHRHTTPFEMCELKLLVYVPMDAWRQWIRHRTACLSGDTVLQFDLPSGLNRHRSQLYKLTMKEVYDRFQPTENKTRPDKQRNPHSRRDRVQKMLLRCLNEDAQRVVHTKIVDIWESGKKPVYMVTLENGEWAKMSRDHLCLTNVGWRQLHEITPLPSRGTVLDTRTDPDGVRVIRLKNANGVDGIVTVGPGKNTGIPPFPVDVDVEDEEWRPIVDWEDYYLVSDCGRVRRIAGGRGSRSLGRHKKITVSKGRAVVSLNRPGEQITRFVHQLVLDAFEGPCPEGLECCHNDGNALNNQLENLRWDTPQSNADDRMRDGATTKLAPSVSRILNVQYIGEEMTYDLEVSGPWHNFSANGMIVHNSVNEYSTRYSIAIDEAAITCYKHWRLQSKSNKQGSRPEGEMFFPESFDASQASDLHQRAIAAGMTAGEYLTDKERTFLKLAREIYEERIEFGIAREQARKDLPLSTFTLAYWKIDLHNLFHFLGLRREKHAQKEIRDYAMVLGDQLVKPWVPYAWGAFQDYRENALYLTALDTMMIQAMAASPTLQGVLSQAERLGWLERTSKGKLKRCRERTECAAKLRSLNLPVPWSKDGEA